MCLQPINLRINGETVPVPCGYCPECLKARSDDLSVRLMRCNRHYPKLFFLTLTYNQKNVPVAGCFSHFNTSTGLLVHKSDPFILPKELQFMLRPMVIDFVHRKVNRKPMVAEAIDSLNGNEHVILEVAPSINRKQVKLWIKRCRTSYERDSGKKLPEFKLAFTGEYGSVTGRPHFHVCLLSKDLSLNQVYYMTSRWKLGTCDVRSVPVNDSINVVQYISKYVSKGPFEEFNVQNRVVERPRFCTSRGLALIDTDKEKLINHFRCYDIFDEYDINDEKFVSSLTDDQVSLIVNRMHYSLDGRMFHLPKCIKDVCFKVKDPIRKYYTSSALSRKIADYLSRRSDEVYFSKLHEIQAFSEPDSEASFVLLENAEEDFKTTLSTSHSYYRRLRLQIQKSKC